MATKAPKASAGAPKASAGKGFLHAQWHGIPVPALAAGGAVAAYFLYKHFTSSSSSSSSTPSVAATTGTGTGSSGNGGYSGGGGGGWGPNSNPNNPPVPGAKWGSPCPGMPAQWIPPGAVYNCPNIPTKIPKEPPAHPASPTSIPVVTPAAAKTAQAQVALQHSTAATTSPQAAGLGSTPSSSASQVYTQLASTPSYGSLPASTVSQIATQTAAGTGPHGYYGTPSALSPAQVTQLDATNHVNPYAGTAEQQAIAASAPRSDYQSATGSSVSSGWSQVPMSRLPSSVGNAFALGQPLPSGWKWNAGNFYNANTRQVYL